MRSTFGYERRLRILVVTEAKLAEVGDVPGRVYREALRNGKVVYESGE